MARPRRRRRSPTLPPGEHFEDGKIASDERLSSVGRPNPLIRVEIMDDANEILPRGPTGEICVRGDLVMKGYYKAPEKTAEAIVDGWLHTGDIGYLDGEGYLHIVDREKDMIITGGFNVYPSEVEQVIWGHPAVQDCAVIGVPDDKWGEAVKAVVELNSGQQVSAEELIALCKEKLGSVKAPKSVDFVDAIAAQPGGQGAQKGPSRTVLAGPAANDLNAATRTTRPALRAGSARRMSYYRNKVAVITGAGSGIGRELARLLAAQGARLAISDIDDAGLAATRQLCGNAEVRTYRLDVSKREQVFGHADDVKRDFGAADFVFNNAGVTLIATFEHSTIEEIDWLLGINLWGVIYGTKAFLPMMLERSVRLHRQPLQHLRARRGADAIGVQHVQVRGARARPRHCGASSTALACGPSRYIPAASARTSTRRAAWAAMPATTNASSLRRSEACPVTPPEHCAGDILRGVDTRRERILTGKSSRTRRTRVAYRAAIVRRALQTARPLTAGEGRTAWRMSTSRASA